MRIAFASARSSPGVTTTVVAFASAWAGPVLIVEGSEDGGALAPRFGLRLEPGLTTLAAAIRRESSPDVLGRHTQALPDAEGRIKALVGPPTPESAQLLLRTAADGLAALFADVDGDVLIDAGRLPPAPAALPLLTSADRLVLVARPRVEELQTLAHRIPVLRDLGLDPRLLLVGSAPYGPDEVAATLSVEVVGGLVDDRRTADVLAGVGSSRRLDRSPLLRSAATLAPLLAADAPSSARTSSAPAASEMWASNSAAGVDR